MKLLVALAFVAIIGCAIARPTRDLKSDLITKGNDLAKKADDAITKLTADKKTHEVTVIKAEETRIKKLITDLTAETDEAKVKNLERELGALEARLNHELTRINQVGPVVVPPKTPDTPANPAKRDAKSDLIQKGNDLVKKAEEAITKLEADKKTQAVTQIKTHEAHLKKVIADLTAATDDAKVKTLEHELTLAENRFNHELTRIAAEPKPVDPPKTPDTPANPAKRDLKSDLITKGTDLAKKAEDAITKLEADKKTHEATMIKTEEAHIKKLISDLQAATDDAKVKIIEHDLNVAENRLAHELTRINSQPANPPKTPVDPPKTPDTPAKRDAKSDLIQKGNDLLKKADEAITKLEADKKTHEVPIIKGEETRIKKLIADLTAETDEAKVKMLERELGGLEARLNHELTRINGTGPVVVPPKTPDTPANPAKRDAKSDLIEKGNTLVKKAEDAITKLEADKKTQAATMVKTHEAHLKKVIADLTAATDDAKVKTLEHELTLAENRLDHELTRIAAMPANPPKTPDTPPTNP